MESVERRLTAQFEWYREHVYYARLKESFGTGFYFLIIQHPIRRRFALRSC